MAVTSSPVRQISWRKRREAANLLLVLANEQSRIAERLTQLRRVHALTQENAAARAGVTLRQWQRWESGESEPYARNIAKLSEEFGVPLEEFVGSEPAAEPSQLDRIEQQVRILRTEMQKLTQALHQQAEALHAETTARIAAEAEQAGTRSDSPATATGGTAR